MISASSHAHALRAASLSRAIPTVYVVDDDISIRESLEMLIKSGGWEPQIFASAEAFLSRPRVLAPSCLILDLTLPGLNGLDLQKRIVDRTSMPIIFITGLGDVETSVCAMKAGAVEFLTKPLGDEVLLRAIEDAIDRSSKTLAHEVEMRSLRDRYESLSSREREVMELVVRGRLNKQVGGELGIAEITAKVHRGNVMRKMRAGSLADLVNIAARLRAGAARQSGTARPVVRS